MRVQVTKRQLVRRGLHSSTAFGAQLQAQVQKHGDL
jgi:hypothetical protein